MTRQVLFQIHWFLGITAGLVLAVMGVTGAMMSFDQEIIHALSHGIVDVAPQAGPRLTPDELVARASAQQGLPVSSLDWPMAAGASVRVGFAAAPGQSGRGPSSYANPYTGQLLGSARGEAFFATVRRVHRWLALPGNGNGWGRTLTGIASLSLIYFALSGLYLRWPRQPLDWRAWLVLDLRRTGRNLYRALHAVVGGWLLLFYLLSGSTGLWWSYDWYRSGVTYLLTGQSARPDGGRGAERGAEAPGQGDRQRGEGARRQGQGERRGAQQGGMSADGMGPAAGTDTGRRRGRPHDEAPAPPPLATAWASFLQQAGDRYQSAALSLPQGDGPLRIRALRADARHERMSDDYQLDPRSGAVLKWDTYADRSLGQVITGSMLILHRGALFGLPGEIALMLSSLSMPLFTVTGLLLYLGRRKRKKALRSLQPLNDSAAQGEGLLIAYASQTGGAHRLARQTAAAFESVGQPTRVVSLARLAVADLARAGRALFVVSTYGDGAAPDEANAFCRRVMAAPAALGQLNYAVLALGDREYPDFCAFGRRLDDWLARSQARALFDRVELDGEDGAAQQRWETQLEAMGAGRQVGDWQPEPFSPWRLQRRELLNAGSPGAPVYRIVLRPDASVRAEWQPGDIAEILPRQEPARVTRWLTALASSSGESPSPLLGEQLALRELASQPPTPVTALVDLPLLRPREYSIASLSEAGEIELLVRQSQRADGAMGLASGWLIAHASLGGTIDLRLRANPGFRTPAADTPLILIGNGTGLAGLLAHLRHRVAHARAATWLLFGERSGQHDRLCGDELDGYVADGRLSRLDRIFSRDAGGGYVQQLLSQQAERLHQWVGEGAAIYVCGSLHGMAPQLDAVLREVLGSQRLDHLAEQGRYRRDIY